MEYTNGSFINALFEGKHYVGQLIDIDDTKEDQPLLINFMTKTQCHKVAQFKWPSSKIKYLICMNSNEILLCIPPPVAGKSGIYRLSHDVHLPSNLIFG